MSSSAVEGLTLLLEHLGLDGSLAAWIHSAHEEGDAGEVEAMLAAAAPSTDTIQRVLSALQSGDFAVPTPSGSSEHPSIPHENTPEGNTSPAALHSPVENPRSELLSRQKPIESFDTPRAAPVDGASFDFNPRTELDMANGEHEAPAENEEQGEGGDGEQLNEEIGLSYQLPPSMRFLCDLSPEEQDALAAQDDETLFSLLALLAAEEQAPPCRHFVAGGCYRSDCWFSHDLSSIPCRFYLAGYCKDGETCPFMHALAPPAVLAGAAWLRGTLLPLSSTHEEKEKGGPPQGLVFAQDDESHFPSLLTAKPQSKSMLSSPSKLSFANIAAAPPPPSAQSPATTAAAAAVSKHLLHTSNLPSRMGRFSSSDYPGLWVNAGAEVSAQYQRLRAAAIERAQARNRLFGEARRAYGAADTRAAKSLATRARALDEEMRELHREAAAAILGSRNRGSAGHDVLDLHGLHVSEALHFLEAWLDNARAAGRIEGFVVTGAGHHSQHRHLVSSQQARLFPAVLAYLQERGLRLRLGTGNLTGTIHFRFT
eukprot:m.53864 g.53864  ORF g.53864 m.53864 type:complete len:540 (-) comp11853_c0_seq4:28-1647(-)